VGLFLIPTIYLAHRNLGLDPDADSGKKILDPYPVSVNPAAKPLHIGCRRFKKTSSKITLILGICIAQF
jgi:hypothetical protein